MLVELNYKKGGEEKKRGGRKRKEERKRGEENKEGREGGKEGMILIMND